MLKVQIFWGTALILCASDSQRFQGWYFLTDSFHKNRIFNLRVPSLLTGIEGYDGKEITIFSSWNIFWMVSYLLQF
jgi:hypothetical protein